MVAIVGGGENPAFSPRCMRLYDTSANKQICEKQFDYPIVAVLMNYYCMVVVLENRIHIFDIDTMKPTYRLHVASNPIGLCDMQHVPSREACSGLRSMLLCYPASSERGSVSVFDAVTQKVVQVVDAHENPIQALALSKDGTHLATASTKGTLIRVFAASPIFSSEPDLTFRRGVLSSTICAIRFNDSGTLLCVGSTNGTIHVFPIVALPEVNDDRTHGEAKNAPSETTFSQIPAAIMMGAATTFSSAARSLYSGIMTTLPPEISSQRRTCAVTIKTGVQFMCGFLSSKNETGEHAEKDGAHFPGANDSLVVATSMGIVCVYGLDLMAGESRLENQEFLFPQPEH